MELQNFLSENWCAMIIVILVGVVIVQWSNLAEYKRNRAESETFIAEISQKVIDLESIIMSILSDVKVVDIHEKSNNLMVELDRLNDKETKRDVDVQKIRGLTLWRSLLKQHAKIKLKEASVIKSSGASYSGDTEG